MPRRPVLRHRALTAVSLLCAVAVVAVGCGDDDQPAADHAGPSTSLTLSVHPKASMWTDGTADCPVTGKPAAEIASAKPAHEGVDGVLTFGTQSQDHVSGCVDYPVSPPVGGAHNPVWSNCGFYSSAVPNEHAVHDLEHGAVWIAFGADVDAATLDRIRQATTGATHVLASPYPGLGTKIVMSAWSRQLTLDEVTDPRFQKFLDLYVQGAQTPELGAPCSGGMGTPS
jgi:hypothetical protein